MRTAITSVALCSLTIGSAALGQNLNDRINYVVQQRAAAEAQNSSKAEMLGALLYTDVTVNFQQVKVRDAINHIAKAAGINIVGRYNDDKTGFGIDPETEVTLDVQAKPALTVLEMLLDMASDGIEENTWQIREGFVEVGTKDRLSAGSARETRYYPIRDLLFEPPYFDNAPTLNLQQALQQGGGGGGGGGRGGGSSGGGGGGFGGGGGGGGGRGGGGSIFGEPGQEGERATEEQKAQDLIEIITEIVEPDAWETRGGDQASIRYYTGALIIRAPDFIHRQIGGYPFAIRPTRGPQVSTMDLRYVTFSGSLSNVEIIDERQIGPFPAAVSSSGP